MTADPDLDRAVETIIVDAYGDDEQYTAFLTVIEEQIRLPATATLLGTPVTVIAFDYTDDRGIIARCAGPDGAGEISLADLAFPPETVAAWIHAAYRYWLGLRPFPATPRPGWTWPGRPGIRHHAGSFRVWWQEILFARASRAIRAAGAVLT